MDSQFRMPTFHGLGNTHAQKNLMWLSPTQTPSLRVMLQTIMTWLFEITHKFSGNMTSYFILYFGSTGI
jgi:hypothetical protein